MTRPVHHADLVEQVARRMLADIDDHGGVDAFCEKLAGFPEQYLTDLALGAVDCIALGQCLHPRVIYP